MSIGYAFVKYIEENAGGAPVGGYFSLSGTTRVAPELDLGWQRDSKDLLGETLILNTFTATLGPKVQWEVGSTRPYFHVLGGLRHDESEGRSLTAWGGQAGAGLDVKIGESVALRVGAGLQIFFDEGEYLETVRVLAGVTF